MRAPRGVRSSASDNGWISRAYPSHYRFALAHTDVHIHPEIPAIGYVPGAAAVDRMIGVGERTRCLALESPSKLRLPNRSLPQRTKRCSKAETILDLAWTNAARNWVQIVFQAFRFTAANNSLTREWTIRGRDNCALTLAASAVVIDHYPVGSFV